MNVHELTLQNYAASGGCPSACQPMLYLGTAGSYGNEQINVVLGEGWQGLTVKAVFQPSGVPVVVPDGGGVISVPWEATQSVVAYPHGRISFQGYVSGRLVNTSDVPYTVGGSSAGSDNTPAPTPDEFQQFVDAVKSDADRAAQAAADAEAAVQEVKDAGTQAVTDIGNAKDSALEAIDAAREEAAGSISADVEGAKQAAADAEQSAADAEQSAKDAADALANVQAAGKSALEDIATERQNTLSDIQNEGAKQQSAVAGAGTAALEAIGQTEQAAINQVRQAGATQASAVQSAGTTQISQVNSAGAAQVQAVKDEGAAQTAALNDAADAHKNELESIASHPPQPNTATGKWQVWNAETGAYQDTDALYQGGYYTPAVSDDGVLTWQGSQAGMPSLPSANIKGPKGDKGDPGLGVPATTTSDAGKVPTVKADGSAYELAGPYAPLSAAIRPTASGNPVNITDSVEWPLLGLKVYGKSTQATTTGAQLFNTKSFIEKNAECYKLSEDGGIIQIQDDYRGAGDLPISQELAAGTYTASINTANFTFQIVQSGVEIGFASTDKSFTFTLEAPAQMSFKIWSSDASDYSRTTAYPMLVSGSAAKPWEPYTGGKPSPSPEYPQPIVSAGEGGSVELTVTGANLLNILDDDFSSGGLTVEAEKGILSINGTPDTINYNEQIATFIAPAHVHCYLRAESTLQSTNVRLIFNVNAGAFLSVGNGAPIELQPGDVLSVYLRVDAIQSYNVTFKPMLNYGTSALPWKPYNSQSLTLSTHTGLPGIPVDSGGNYTDAEGQQSACDVKDYGTGKYTQMVGHIESYNGENITTPYMSTTGQLSTGAEVYYVLDEPVVTDISADELTAYRTLHTYDGATVVSTAEDVTGLEVKYVADAQKYIDDRLAAAESHIQEIAAAQLNAQTGG